MITYGQYKLIDPEDAQVYAYRRIYQGKTLLIIANFTSECLVRHYKGVVQEMVLNNYDDELLSLELINLAPYQALVLDVLNSN